MIREYAEIFCWKNVSSFCSAKATHIFSAKNIRILYIESAKTVNEITLNEFVKLTTLWTAGPWALKLSARIFCASEIDYSHWPENGWGPKLVFSQTNICPEYHGPVVQSIVSLMSSLLVKMLTVLVSTISISQAFCKSYSHFFRQKY